MKVLDLQCGLGHVFEGWFGSEADFVAQHQKSLVLCPLCGDPCISKKLSAPRLALSRGRAAPDESEAQPKQSQPASSVDAALTAAWLAVAKRLVSETTDVGSSFAEEARKMHYGEAQPRGIRGIATADEAHALVDEGIDVLPFPLPVVPEGRLQ